MPCARYQVGPSCMCTYLSASSSSHPCYTTPLRPFSIFQPSFVAPASTFVLSVFDRAVTLVPIICASVLPPSLSSSLRPPLDLLSFSMFHALLEFTDDPRAGGPGERLSGSVAFFPMSLWELEDLVSSGIFLMAACGCGSLCTPVDIRD